MSGGENSAFLADPLEYIKAKPLDITRFSLTVEGHLEVRAAYEAERTLDTWWRGMGPSYMKDWTEIQFDIIKRRKQTTEGNKDSYIFRVDRRSFSDPQKTRMTNARWTGFDLAKHPVVGHFFPYNSPPGGTPDVTSGKWGIADMGQVDFLRENPRHPFVFTGAMNGCAIVITESPRGGDYYRVYHYPNAASYPQFQPPGVWPHQPLYYWTFADYGGADEMEADALNFLCYTDGEWHLCCQPHKWIKTTEMRQGAITEVASSVPVTAIRTKPAAPALPGAIPLARLRRTFA